MDGAWNGVLDATLHLVLTVQRKGDALTGVLDSVDQGAVLPIDRITFDGSKLHFEITGVEGAYDGTLDAAGAKLDGTWTQHGHSGPLAFARGAPPAEAVSKPPPRPLDAPLDVRVPEPPAVLRAGGHTHLVYELHVANDGGRTVTLDRIEVSARGAPVAHLEGQALADAVKQPGGAPKVEIGAGTAAVVFMWVTLPSEAVPPALDHRIELHLARDPDALAVPDVRIPVVARPPLVLGPPLRGAGWMAANGPANDSAHRRALIPVGGRARIAQRFAIDWVKLGDDGASFHGDPKKNESYLAYGVDALAVGDGVVTETKDGIPQNVPGPSSRAVPITLETIGGNHVILDLGGGRFAFYAHLQPGSLKVKLGDHVRRGQVLGLVGNSGNSTEPHLHFHLEDASSPLGAEGLPYALDSFQLEAPGKPAVTRRREIPAKDERVAFPR